MTGRREPAPRPVPYLADARAHLIARAEAARPGWKITFTPPGTWTGTRADDEHEVTAANLPDLTAAIDAVPPPRDHATMTT
jgi:hypothetical protein